MPCRAYSYNGLPSILRAENLSVTEWLERRTGKWDEHGWRLIDFASKSLEDRLHRLLGNMTPWGLTNTRPIAVVAVRFAAQKSGGPILLRNLG